MKLGRVPNMIDASNKDSSSRPTKLLSICLCARNDDYCGNFRFRFETTLNHFAKNAKELGIIEDVEVVVTDWNSEEKLGHAINLSNEAAQISRFICVPPEIAAKYNPPNYSFHSTVSMNVATRRSNGQYLLIMPSDIIYSKASIKNLIDLLRDNNYGYIDVDKTLMLISRKYIHYSFIEREPDLDAINRHLLYNSYILPQDIPLPGLAGWMGGTLLNRSLFFEYGGIDEEFGKYGWSDIELGLRIGQQLPSICLNHVGIYCYEMDVRREMREPLWKDENLEIIKKNPVANSPNWGLLDETLEIYKARPHAVPKPPPLRRAPTQKDIIQGLRDTKVAQVLSARFDQDVAGSPEWPFMFLLAYCTTEFQAESFVDFGFMNSIASFAVPLMYPCIQYVGIADGSSHSEGSPLKKTLEIYRQLGFEGRFHAVTGDIETSFRRLVNSIMVGSRFDLVYFIPEMFPHQWPSQLNDVVQHLSQNGAIVIRTMSQENLKQVCEFLSDRSPGALLLKCFQKHAAVFVNSDGAQGQSGIFDPATEEALMNSVLSVR